MVVVVFLSFGCPHRPLAAVCCVLSLCPGHACCPLLVASCHGSHHCWLPWLGYPFVVVVIIMVVVVVPSFSCPSSSCCVLPSPLSSSVSPSSRLPTMLLPCPMVVVIVVIIVVVAVMVIPVCHPCLCSSAPHFHPMSSGSWWWLWVLLQVAVMALIVAQHCGIIVKTYQ